jgi:hypothetical protein
MMPQSTTDPSSVIAARAMSLQVWFSMDLLTRQRYSESSNRAHNRSEQDSGKRQFVKIIEPKGRSLHIEPHCYLEGNRSNPIHRLAEATSARRCCKSLIERHPPPGHSASLLSLGFCFVFSGGYTNLPTAMPL